MRFFSESSKNNFTKSAQNLHKGFCGTLLCADQGDAYMAEISDSIRDILFHFVDELKKNHIHIQQMFLFGSYARGTFDSWSDIDIAIVSDDFSGVRFRDRNAVRRIKLSVSSSLEPLPYRPEDFNATDPFVKKILESGIRVM